MCLRPDPTHRALRILAHLHLSKPGGLGIESQQPAGEVLTVSDDEFQDLIRLKGSDDSREHAQDTSLASSGSELGWRGLREQAPVTRALVGDERRDHPLEPEYRSVHHRDPEV